MLAIRSFWYEIHKINYVDASKLSPHSPSPLVSCPDSLLHTEKESGETLIQFWFSLNVRDVLWRSHNSTLRACIIIRIRTAERLALPSFKYA